MPTLPPSIRFKLVLAAAGIVALSCSDNTGPTVEQPQSIRVEVPEYAAGGQPFQLRVTAHGGSASVPLASFSGSVQLTVSSGTITPQSVQLSSGVGTVQARILGTTGDVTVTGSLAGLTDSETLRLVDQEHLLAGESGDPVGPAIPNRPFDVDWDSYTTDHPALPGIPLSNSTLLLVFEDGTTVAEANELLAALESEIVGGIPGTADRSGILFLRLPTGTHEEVDAARELLRSSPRVLSAAPDVLLAADWIPQPSQSSAAAWHWAPSPDEGSGTWGHVLTRIPQAWNLVPAIRKAGADVQVGMLDIGFVPHEDVEYVNQTPDAALDAHGTSAAGIVAARFDNGVGTDGINPRAKLVVRAGAYRGSDASLQTRRSWGKHWLEAMELLLDAVPAVRVVNVSMGYNWYTAGINPGTELAAQQLAEAHGREAAQLMDLQQASGRTPLVIVAAGNDSGSGTEVDARYNSPFAAAGLIENHPAVLVVEAIRYSDGATGNAMRWRDANNGSNHSGHLSAPGFQVGVAAATANGYDRAKGTSIAAPFVTGLASLLLSVDPALSRDQLRSILTSTSVPVQSASNRIDAFAALLEIDRVGGNNRVLELLLDVDDGTPDGNMRIDPRTGADYIDDVQGDGRIDMRDFRRWRDALLKVQAPTDLMLDGSADHPKKDLNGDGTPPQAGGPSETVHPRFDFNGDGLVDADLEAYVGGNIQREVTDLELMQHVFEDHHYEASDLSELQFSADIAIHPEKLRNEFPDAEIRSSVRPAGSAAAQDDRRYRRLHTGASAQGDGLWQVYTLVSGTDYIGRIDVIAAPDDTLALEKTFSTRPGEDFYWDPSAECSELAAAAPTAGFALAQSTGIVCAVTVEPEAVTLAPGAARQFTATVVVVGSTNEEVTWAATGGTITEAGLYTAGTAPGSFTVTATSVADATASAEASVIISEHGTVVPVWNRSEAYAAAFQQQEHVQADSSDFSGFFANLTANDANQEGSANHTAIFEYDGPTGLSGITSTAAISAVGRRSGNGNGYADTRLNLLFDVVTAPVGFRFTANCTVESSMWDASLKKRDSPSLPKHPVNLHITEDEYKAGECSNIELVGTLPPGRYEFEVYHVATAVIYAWDEEDEMHASSASTLELQFLPDPQ